MGHTVIVFSFPDPKNPFELGEIIKKAKSIFADTPNLKVHLANDDASKDIMHFLAPVDISEEETHEDKGT